MARQLDKYTLQSPMTAAQAGARFEKALAETDPALPKGTEDAEVKFQDADGGSKITVRFHRKKSLRRLELIVTCVSGAVCLLMLLGVAAHKIPQTPAAVVIGVAALLEIADEVMQHLRYKRHKKIKKALTAFFAEPEPASEKTEQPVP